MTVGVFDLAIVEIGVALTAQPQTAITDLEGMQAVTITATLAVGTAGSSVAAVIQTSLDDGNTWLDVARFDFTTASATKVANLNGLLSKAVTAYAALASEGVLDGVLGSRLRCVVTSVGTYANTLLSVRAAVR